MGKGFVSFSGDVVVLSGLESKVKADRLIDKIYILRHGHKVCILNIKKVSDVYCCASLIMY